MTLTFTCPRCGASSANPNDVSNLYCGACHLTLDEMGVGPAAAYFLRQAGWSHELMDYLGQALCPTCPQCGRWPRIMLGKGQAFCDGEDCDAFAWNPSLSPAANIAGTTTIDLRTTTDEL